MKDNTDRLNENNDINEEIIEKENTKINDDKDQSNITSLSNKDIKDTLNTTNTNKTNIKTFVSSGNNNNKIDESSEKKDVIPKKEPPIEKKPFNEFVNEHLIPTIIYDFKQRGFEINAINLKNTLRPIAGDKCWVIYCEIKDICNFWLSFETEDICSLKSISLSKPNQNPSVIESFLIDEKRITLKLITSRILQRLNGQKLIGVN